MTTMEERRAILERMGTAEAVARLKALVGEIEAAEAARDDMRVAISDHHWRAEVREAHLRLEVQGGNDVERKVRLVLVLNEDVEWNDATKDESRAIGHRYDAERRAAQLRREWAGLAHFIQLRAAQITFMGGAGHDNAGS